jgi:hypothetical protein
MDDDVHTSRRFATPEERQILETAVRCYRALPPRSPARDAVRADVQKALPDWTDRQIYRWIINHEPPSSRQFSLLSCPTKVDFLALSPPRETSASLERPAVRSRPAEGARAPVWSHPTLVPFEQHIDRLRALLGSVVAPVLPQTVIERRQETQEAAVIQLFASSNIPLRLIR